MPKRIFCMTIFGIYLVLYMRNPWTYVMKFEASLNYDFISSLMTFSRRVDKDTELSGVL